MLRPGGPLGPPEMFFGNFAGFDIHLQSACHISGFVLIGFRE